jgi:hypothetical protein
MSRNPRTPSDESKSPSLPESSTPAPSPPSVSAEPSFSTPISPASSPPALPATRASARAPAHSTVDATYAYNGDLGIAPGSADLIRRRFAHSPPLIEILLDAELNKRFESYENAAKGKKAGFHTLGVLSLVAAGVGLAVTAIELMAHAYVGSAGVVHSVSSAGAGLAVVGLVVAITLTHVAGYRKKWLDNRYYAERLRQWHFDTLLDSDLTSLASTDIRKFKEERKVRMDEFCGTLTESRTSWLSMNDDLLVTPSHATKSVSPAHPLHDDIWKAFCWLRLDHQWRHWGIKTGTDERLHKTHRLVESISQTCFQVAVVATVAQALGISALWLGLLPQASWIDPAGIALAGVQLMLLAISVAFERADGGLGLSQEMEHYQRMAMVYMGIKDRATRATSDDARFEIMRNVEV